MTGIMEIVRRMRRDESFVKKMAIGCGITFVPILNIFAFGFLFQVAKQARRGEKMTVPEWRQWDALFVDGIRFLIVLTTYFVMPLAVGWLLINILSVLSLGIPLNVAYLPFSIALLLAPAFTCVGLTRFLDTDDWLALFEFKEIVSNVVSAREILFVPSLIFAAMQFFLFPLYGISFFLGFLFILPYYTAYISKKR